MPVSYLTCDHCLGINEVTTEYITFCVHCEKKITCNFNDWKKENGNKSFEDFKAIVCHNNIFHWQPDTSPVQKKIYIKPNFAYLLIAVVVISTLIVTGVYRGPEITAGIGNWVKARIQSGNGNGSWETTNIPDGNFQIKFPASPSMRKETAETVMGNIEQLVIESKPPIGMDDNLSYEASILVYPPEKINSRVITKQQTDQFLHHTIEGLARVLGGNIISEENVDYGLYPGKEVSLNCQEGMAEIKFRLYLIGNTLYTLKVTSVSNSTNNKSREYFLNSFKLITYAQASR